MNFQSEQSDLHEMSEINVTPLVDVMLVLLVVFIVTAPLLTQAVKVNLPQTAAVEPPTQEHVLTLSVQADGALHFGGRIVADTNVEQELGTALQHDPQLIVHLQGDDAVHFGNVAKVLAAAQRAGISKLSVITRPQ
jgi:biopolymer transport protein ExbD